MQEQQSQVLCLLVCGCLDLLTPTQTSEENNMLLDERWQETQSYNIIDVCIILP